MLFTSFMVKQCFTWTAKQFEAQSVLGMSPGSRQNADVASKDHPGKGHSHRRYSGGVTIELDAKQEAFVKVCKPAFQTNSTRVLGHR